MQNKKTCLNMSYSLRVKKKTQIFFDASRLRQCVQPSYSQFKDASLFMSSCLDKLPLLENRKRGLTRHFGTCVGYSKL